MILIKYVCCEWWWSWRADVTSLNSCWDNWPDWWPGSQHCWAQCDMSSSQTGIVTMSWQYHHHRHKSTSLTYDLQIWKRRPSLLQRILRSVSVLACLQDAWKMYWCMKNVFSLSFLSLIMMPTYLLVRVRSSGRGISDSDDCVDVSGAGGITISYWCLRYKTKQVRFRWRINQ